MMSNMTLIADKEAVEVLLIISVISAAACQPFLVKMTEQELSMKKS